MIGEILGVVNGLVFVVAVTKAYRLARFAKNSETFETMSAQARLIVELLQTEDGWSFESRRVEHELGIRIYVDLLSLGSRVHYSIRVSIKDDAGMWSEAELSSNDEQRVRKEVQALRDRRRDREQSELARVLARRVLAREEAVLGDDGVSAVDLIESSGKRLLDHTLSSGPVVTFVYN